MRSRCRCADFKLVDNQYSAGLMIFIAILASLLILTLVEAIHRSLGVPGLASNGGRGYLAIALIAVAFTCFGFFGHYYIGENTTTQQRAWIKPSVIKFAPVHSAAKISVTHPELVPYISSEPNTFNPMIETVPYSEPTTSHVFTVGPGDAIQTAYAFLEPGDKSGNLTILKTHRDKEGDDVSVFVPQADAGDRVLLLLRTTRDINFYPGDVK